MAIESDLVTADMVDAAEFPHLAVKYAVHGVPRTVVNEVAFVDGALPEAGYLDEVLKGAGLAAGG
jgi:hypothetical protein